MPFIGSRPSNVISKVEPLEFNYVATSGQTTFSAGDTDCKVLSYPPCGIVVFLNGVRLEEADFTAINGSTVVLASCATVDDTLSIIAQRVNIVNDAVSKTYGGTFSGKVTLAGGVAGSSAAGSGSNQIFYENDQTVTGSYTLAADRNAMSTGPLSINSGVVITVESGARWVIV